MEHFFKLITCKIYYSIVKYVSAEHSGSLQWILGRGNLHNNLVLCIIQILQSIPSSMFVLCMSLQQRYSLLADTQTFFLILYSFYNFTWQRQCKVQLTGISVCENYQLIYINKYFLFQKYISIHQKYHNTYPYYSGNTLAMMY